MNAIEMIAAERQRQIDVEGYDTTHDTQHDCGELASLACYYALPPYFVGKDGRENFAAIEPDEIFAQTKFDFTYAKRTNDRIRCLVKAGALIAAEIDRLHAEQGQGATMRNDDLPDTECPNCHETGYLFLEVTAAYHDPKKLDIILTCAACHRRYNAFLNIDIMLPLED